MANFGIKIMNKLYKDKNGKIYSFNNIQDVPDGMVVLSSEETDNHLNPIPTVEQLSEQARAKRDKLLGDVLWRLERYCAQVSLSIDTDDSQALYERLLMYAQNLRDVPQQPNFPDEINWPTMPV